LLGGVVGQKLFDLMSLSLFVVFGWASRSAHRCFLGTFDMLSRFVRQEEHGGAAEDLARGTWRPVGGLLGGFLYLLMQDCGNHPAGQARGRLWSLAPWFRRPRMCIGLMIGLAQSSSASVGAVEAGVRAGGK